MNKVKVEMRHMNNIKTTNKHGKFLERDAVKYLVGKIDALAGLSVYTRIDQDSAARLFEGGYDFRMTSKGKINYFEAKRTVEKAGRVVKDTPEKLLKSMRSSETKFALKCHMCKTPYYLLHFLIEDFMDNAILDEIIRVNLYKLTCPLKHGKVSYEFSSVLDRADVEQTTKYLVGLLK